MLWNRLDSAKGQVLSPESGRFPADICICKTHATAPSRSAPWLPFWVSCISSGKPTRTAHRASPSPLRPKPLIQTKFPGAQWHLQHRRTSHKDLIITASLFACLERVQSNYRSFNDLRQSQGIAMLFQHKSLYFTFTAALLKPPASPGGAHCNELVRKTWRYKPLQCAPTSINASFGACSSGKLELRKLCRSMFHCEKAGFRQGEVL